MSEGTKNLKEAVDLALTVVDVIVSSGKDGKIDAADLGQLLKLIPAVSPAIDGIGQIPAELKDLSVEEAAELAAHIMASLSVDDPKARAVVDASLKLIGAGVSLVQALKA